MLLSSMLAVLVGLALGVLGGGGSILTVPILIFAAELDPHTAIATSLLVVFVTSLVALIPHARAGHVRWKAALVFGGAGLVGAFAGGRAAAFVPANGLLLGFAVLMLGTSVAMIRGRNHASVCNETGAVAHHKRILPMAVWGLLVGAVTGLVGAGGGFVVVPVLSLIGGLSMPVAVGTSLLVIALNSAAGFMGHWQEVSIPWTLAAAVAIPASVAALVGVRLSKRLPETLLRPLFGWAVLVMSLFVFGSQLPPSLRAAAIFQSLFVQRWPFWAAGAAIGGVVLAFLWSENKLLGVSTGCAELCSLQRDPKPRGSWRVLFIAGIVFGGFAATTISGTHPTWNHGAFDQLFWSSLWIKAPVLIVGGVLVGFGARAAGGCTSGHGIVGMAQGARSSFLATFAFMIGGFATTALITLAKGGM